MSGSASEVVDFRIVNERQISLVMIMPPSHDNLKLILEGDDLRQRFESTLREFAGVQTF
jgi:hypothetical protein